MADEGETSGKLSRAGGDRGLSLAERLAAAASRLGYAGPLHRRKLRGRFPLKLLAIPVDPVQGDRDAGERLKSGRLVHGGFGVGLAEARLADPDAPAAWREWLHAFDGLRDLAAAGDKAQCARVAEPLARRWLAAFPDYHPEAWRADLTGRRLFAWMAHAPLLMASNDLVHRSAVLNAIARWARHLDEAAPRLPDGLGKLDAAVGLLSAGLLLPGGEKRQAEGEALLARLLPQLQFGDGMVASRCPADQVRMIERLQALEAAYVARNAPAPDLLARMLPRSAAALAKLVMGDGATGPWHGGLARPAAQLSRLEALAEAAPPASGAASSGYQRLEAAGTIVVIDAGPPPAARASTHAHASTLGFEMSVGRQRLIVSCGGALGLPVTLPQPLLAGLRTTAAHTTLVLADTNSTRIRDDGALGRGVEEVATSRRSGEAGTLVEASHDGYRRRFGFDHRRRLFLAPDGFDLRGEDLLQPAGGRAASDIRAGTLRYDLRFHLGAGVEPMLNADDSGVLLTLPFDRAWRFRARGAAVTVEESLWIAPDGAIHATRQLVVGGEVPAAGLAIAWSLRQQG